MSEEQKIVKKTVPKNFMIRCPRCCWARLSSGTKEDLEDLHEINPNCVNCGKWRKFRCQNCGSPAMMKRIKGNAPIKPKVEEEK